MLTPDLLRNKLGFVQLKIKKTWKLYWRGNLILDSAEILGKGLKDAPLLREFSCGIHCLSEETTYIFDIKIVQVKIDYYPEEGFLVYLSGHKLVESFETEKESILYQLKNCLAQFFIDDNRVKAA